MSNRVVIIDIETTGLDPSAGHRIIEIACVELLDNSTKGGFYHQYINPQRLVPKEASQIHGLSNDFLTQKPVIVEIVDEFLDFINDAPLVVHNTEFDISFLNSELQRTEKTKIKEERILDLLLLIRKKYPNSPGSLDKLCEYFEIDNSDRKEHGALLDAHIVSELYMRMLREH